MSQARFAVAIVADDKTAKGVKSAEKRLGGIGKETNRFGKDLRQIASGSALGSVNKVVKSFGSIEKASARAFGVGSVTARISGRLGGISEAASAAASGLGEASASAGILGGALGAVGVAGVATVAVLVAAGAATYKLVSSWSDAGASLGRLSQMLGIATKDLQEFQGAGQRYGIDKDAMSGAVGGIAKTFHDAKWGRNNEALAIMNRLGVGFKYGKDGQLDYTAMTLDLSDAIARQKDAQTRAMIAEKFGGTAALPLLMKGSATIKSEMKDYSKTGPEMDAKDIAAATSVQRQGVIAKQMAGRVAMKAGGWLGENVASPVMSAVVDGGRNISQGAHEFKEAVQSFVGSVGESVIGRGIVQGKAAVVDAIRRAAGVTGVDPNMMLGIAAQESGLNPNARAKTSSATGLFQFLDGTWLNMVRQHGAKHGLGWASSAIASGSAARGTAMRAKILGLRNDPFMNALMGGELAKDNARALKPVLGRAPDAGENYMANFLGQAGARRFFGLKRQNPNAGAADLFPKEAAANRNIFFAKNGHERTLAEVHSLMTSYVNRPVKIALGTDTKPKANRAGENYMGVLLGGDAQRFSRLERKNPNAGAAKLFPKEATANRDVFYAKDGHERTLAEVRSLMASNADRPVKIVLEINGLPTGAKVKAKGNALTAVGYAMPSFGQGL